MSITLKATLHGHEVMVTLRGVDFASVKAQVEQASPVAPGPERPYQQTTTPQCPKHGAMKPSTKGKGRYCPTSSLMAPGARASSANQGQGTRSAPLPEERRYVDQEVRALLGTVCAP